MKKFFLKRIKALTGFILLLSLAGYLATIHWIFELTSHFKLQYFALSVFFSLVLLLARQWKWASLGILSICLNAIAVLPWYFPTTRDVIQPSLKLLHANINIGNHDYAAFNQLVKSEQADIFIVQEIDTHWFKQLKVFEITFPYSFATRERGIFGTVIYSRFPFEEKQNLFLGRGKLESLLVRFKFNGKIISLLSTHPLPPISREAFEYRNSQLFEVNTVLTQLKKPKILIGDLNISMWSPFYAKMPLHNARQGFGILPTWPNFIPFMMIPIDHCLVSSDIKVVNIKTGPSIGSDHLPLIVELAF